MIEIPLQNETAVIARHDSGKPADTEGSAGDCR